MTAVVVRSNARSGQVGGRTGELDVVAQRFAAASEALDTRRLARAIEREHATATVVQAALARHAERRLPARSPLAVLAAATQNEQHTLPLDALAAALAEAGVATCLLGTLPPSALHAAVGDVGPAVVILWARSTSSTDAAATLRRLTVTTPVVCAAGAGWKPGRLPAGVTHLTDLPTAVESVLDLTM